MDEDETAKSRPENAIGRALESMSVHELDDYANALQAELTRVAAEKARKLSTRAAAERLFGSGGKA